jgi:hypothetical protein
MKVSHFFEDDFAAKVHDDPRSNSRLNFRPDLDSKGHICDPWTWQVEDVILSGAFQVITDLTPYDMHI